ncbi:MAG: phosphoribosylformylglycinamidine synthase subunit PurS [Chitinophagales bacterium]|nr:phosphoribosylformylglycinamidine synthase subunit PurS [Chitinophagales bacterium]HAE13418.1 phosphoribosylformylglycinamidine synthase [Bacteroidota bacterium]MCB9019680.1 phosphoribosylformylglycinamidine synthase subunit PurS [Chitinophagales bacterium]MCB9022092.1 phosphoribosylformylglycinamidine synthase subunit PurS [Chitinophagales bacterium]MCB9031821.1 phosphoribosylformylglycinamidine synthase subunit PurS [Chitinophagales bacterium]
MAYRAEIDIMPLKELLDPKGKAVANNMKSLQLAAVKDVRIGKHITLEIQAGSEEEARTMTETACKKLLANPIMESYTFEVFPM